MSYVDDLMMNKPLDSEEEYTQSSSYSSPYEYYDSEEDVMKGGKLSEHVGLGGFPPIFICEKELTDTESPFEDEAMKTKREYSKTKSTVSIANIMEERRNIKPFITLN